MSFIEISGEGVDAVIAKLGAWQSTLGQSLTTGVTAATERAQGAIANEAPSDLGQEVQAQIVEMSAGTSSGQVVFQGEDAGIVQYIIGGVGPHTVTRDRIGRNGNAYTQTTDYPGVAANPFVERGIAQVQDAMLNDIGQAIQDGLA